MPVIKIKAKAEARNTGFEAYAGPMPERPGAYRGRIKQIRWREFAKGSAGFNVLVELEATDNPAAKKYDGAPFWRNLIAVTADGSPLKDFPQQQVDAFLAAIGAGDDPAISTEDGDAKRAVNVTRIGKAVAAKIIGTPVIVDLALDSQNTTEDAVALEVRVIRPSDEDQTEVWPGDTVQVAEDEDDEDLPESEGSDEDVPFEEREAELKKMGVKDLRELAQSDYDLETKGLAKAALVEAILDYEYPEDEPAVLADDAEEDEEEDDEVEVEDEDEDDEEEEDEDDEAEDSPWADRESGLADMDRTALKAAIRAANPEFKIFKSTTDDAIRHAILVAEFPEYSPIPF